MRYHNYYLVLRRPTVSGNLLDLMETARQACIHPELLQRMVDLGLIEPAQSSPQVLFSPEVVGTIGKAVRLRYQLGINWAAVGLVIDLLERIEALETEIDRLKKG